MTLRLAVGETVPSLRAWKAQIGSSTTLTADFKFDSPLLDLHYTEYRTGGHGIWGQVYNTTAMYNWMFAHVAVPEPASAVLLLIASANICLQRRRTA